MEGAPQSQWPARVSALLTLLVCASATAWLAVDGLAPMWDQARHAWNVLRLLTLMQEVARAPWRLGDVLVWHDQQYAMGGYLVPAVIQAFTGPTLWVPKLVSVWLWTPLLLGSMHVLATRWVKQEWAGVVALAWVASAPMVLDFSKDILLDLPMVSLSALVWAVAGPGTYVLSRRQSIFTGLAVGALLITKAVVPITFVVPPLLLGLMGLRDAQQRKGVLRNLAWAVGATLLVAGPYYSKALPEFLALFQGQARDAASEGDPTSYWESLALYASWWPAYQVHALQLPWLVLGTVMMARSRRAVAVTGVLGVLLVLLVWPLFPNKDPRYVLGWVVAGGLLSSGLVFWHTRAAVVLAVCWLGVMVPAVMWTTTQNVAVRVAGVPLLRTYGYLRGAPDGRVDTAQTLMQQVALFTHAQLAGQAWRRPVLVVRDPGNEPNFNAWNLTYHAYALDRVVEVRDWEVGPQDTELLVTTHCGAVTVPAEPGWVPLTAVVTPKGCVAVAWWNAVRLMRASVLAKPVGPWPWTYVLGRQTQTVVALGLSAQPWTAGGPTFAALATRVDVNRRPDRLVHVLALGDTPVAQWSTSDDSYAQGATQLAFPEVHLPANVVPGSHALTYTVRASRTAGARHDDGAAREQTVLVGNVQVE